MGEPDPGSILRVISAARGHAESKGVDPAPQRLHARRPRLAAALIAAVASLVLLPVAALAVRRPSGPKLVSPRAATTLSSSRVAFHWHRTAGSIGYDLRLARNRTFTTGLQTIAVHRSGATVTLAKGA